VPDPLRVGLIGANANAGWAARAHLPALTNHPDVTLAAVCTTRMESAEEARGRFGAELAFDDWHAMLERNDVAAVCISLRVPNHLEPTLAALAAGKHVYTEWPLGRGTTEAEAMAAAAKRAGTHTMVGLQSRRSAELSYIREVIATGGIGELVSVSMTQFVSGLTERPSSRTWMGDPLTGANTLTISFGHALDGVLTTVGGLAWVEAHISTEAKEWLETDTGKMVTTTAPDNVSMVGRLLTGPLLTCHVESMPWHGSGHRIEIYGREGAIVLEQRGASGPHTGRAKVFRAGRNDTDLAEVTIDDESWIADAQLAAAAVNVAKAWKAFAGAIASDAAVAPTFADAVAHHRLLDVIAFASKTGTRQTVS
jgi:predicted dehydrogenase